MARTALTFDVVREIGLALPGVMESTMHVVPALKASGKLLACVPVHRSAEPNCAMVRIDFEQRTILINASPDTYYMTDHYANYPSVLVRLPRISRDELQSLLGLAWSFVTAAKRTRVTSAAQKSPSKRRRRPL
ncbi:MAG: hypothetical protein ACRD3Q_19465 [Terriglobales bacterium]